MQNKTALELAEMLPLNHNTIARLLGLLEDANRELWSARVLEMASRMEMKKLREKRRVVLIEIDDGALAEFTLVPDDVDAYIVDWTEPHGGHCAFCGEAMPEECYEDGMHWACRMEYKRLKELKGE